MDVKRSVVTGIIALVMLFIGIGIGGAGTPSRTVTETITIFSTKTTTSLYPTTVISTITETLTRTITSTSYVFTTITFPPTTTTITYSMTIPVGGYNGTYRVGEPFRIGNFEYAVLGYTITKYIKSKSLTGEYYYYSAQPQRKIIVVWLNVKNVGIKEDTPYIKAYLITVQRNFYDQVWYIYSSFRHFLDTPTDPAIVSQAVEYVDLRELTPNESIVATILFQIPDYEDPAILLIGYSNSETEYVIVPLR